jgi:hypothetical protein
VSPIIEASERRSARVRWRDRAVTATLWLAWCHPVEALLVAPGATAPVSAWLGEAFLADLAAACRVAGILVAGLLTWGSYARWRAGPRSW